MDVAIQERVFVRMIAGWSYERTRVHPKYSLSQGTWNSGKVKSQRTKEKCRIKVPDFDILMSVALMARADQPNHIT